MTMHQQAGILLVSFVMVFYLLQVKKHKSQKAANRRTTWLIREKFMVVVVNIVINEVCLELIKRVSM
jgi:predicted nucleic acid-binding protein